MSPWRRSVFSTPVEVFLLPVSHHRLEVGAVFQSSTRRISRRPGLDESLKDSRAGISLESNGLPGGVVNQVDGVLTLERQDEVVHGALGHGGACFISRRADVWQGDDIAHMRQR